MGPQTQAHPVAVGSTISVTSVPAGPMIPGSPVPPWLLRTGSMNGLALPGPVELRSCRIRFHCGAIADATAEPSATIARPPARRPGVHDDKQCSRRGLLFRRRRYRAAAVVPPKPAAAETPQGQTPQGQTPQGETPSQILPLLFNPAEAAASHRGRDRPPDPSRRKLARRGRSRRAELYRPAARRPVRPGRAALSGRSLEAGLPTQGYQLPMTPA